MSSRNQLFGIFLAATCLTGPASAAIQVFPANQAPYPLKNLPKLRFEKQEKQTLDTTRPESNTQKDGEITTSALPLKDSLVQQTFELIRNNVTSFGMTEVNAKTLQLRSFQKDRQGTSLRFTQHYGGIPIEGAELIALTDSQQQIVTLNSSLVTTPHLSVLPELSRKGAEAIAIQTLGYQEPELGQGTGDGLLIALLPPEKPVLVFQFSVRDRQNPRHAAQIQIRAQGPDAGKVHKILNITTAHTAIDVYDSSITLVIPTPLYRGVRVIENRRPLYPNSYISSEAGDALGSFEKVLEFYSQNFDRESYDGQGARIDAIVNVQRVGFIDLLGSKENASWMAPWKMFMFGAGGDHLGGLAGALDVVGHEFTHAVISSTSDLVYSHESGALNEHFADLFGAMIQRRYENPEKPFLLGESVLRGRLKEKAEALRDMLQPELGATKQPSHVSQIPAELSSSCVPMNKNDNCGVHLLSGIPNKASALILQALGWEETYSLFYRVMTMRLLSKANFMDYRHQILDECSFSLSAAACETIEHAFNEVGIR